MNFHVFRLETNKRNVGNNKLVELNRTTKEKTEFIVDQTINSMRIKKAFSRNWSIFNFNLLQTLLAKGQLSPQNVLYHFQWLVTIHFHSNFVSLYHRTLFKFYQLSVGHSNVQFWKRKIMRTNSVGALW